MSGRPGPVPHLPCLYCGTALQPERHGKAMYFETREKADRFVAGLARWSRRRTKIDDRQRERALNPNHPDYVVGRRYEVRYQDALGGYGEDKVKKGGTLISVDAAAGTFDTVSVFPDGSTWKPEGFVTTPEPGRIY